MIETKMKHRYIVILSSGRGCVNNRGVIIQRYIVTFLLRQNWKKPVNTSVAVLFQALQKRYGHIKNLASEPEKLITINVTKRDSKTKLSHWRIYAVFCGFSHSFPQ